MMGLDVLMMSHQAERVHGGLVIITTTAALGRPVRMVLLGKATVLVRSGDWQAGLIGDIPADMANLRASCGDLAVEVYVCETGLAVCDMREQDLDADLGVRLTSLPTFLAGGMDGRQWLTI
ncbi:MAG: hypothetical protein AAF442_01505 [Pseudomonadota bacterium]